MSRQEWIEARAALPFRSLTSPSAPPSLAAVSPNVREERNVKRTVCKYAEIQPDRAGRITMRAHSVWPCSCPIPELPALPASITSAYGYSWPPHRGYVDRDRCNKCPCYAAREVSP